MTLQDSYIYIAGLFDGEGWVRINKMKPRIKNRSHNYAYQLYCGINMCDPRAINIVSEIFKGSRYIIKRAKSSNQDLHCWIINSHKAHFFLKTIHPFLIVKREQVDVALEFQEHMDSCRKSFGGRDGRRLAASTIEYRESLFQRIRYLKRYDHLA